MDDDDFRIPDREKMDFELSEINRILYPERYSSGEELSAQESTEPTPGTEPGTSGDTPEAQASADGPRDPRMDVEFVQDMPLRAPEVKEPDKPDRSKGAGNLSGELFGWLQAIVTSLVFIVLLFSFVVRVIGVSGPSMSPTLRDSDKVVLIDSTLANVAPGDVIVFQQPSYSKIPLVKRVIATQGQTVDIDFQTGDVYVDGALSDYVDVPTNRSYDVTFPVVVEAGKLFVMGDNRSESFDSRASAIGQIDQRSVLGKVAFVIYPFSRFGDRP